MGGGYKKKTGSSKKRIEKKSGYGEIDSYKYNSREIPLRVSIVRDKKLFVPVYRLEVAEIGEGTAVLLERIRHELIEKVNLGLVEISTQINEKILEERFGKTIEKLLDKYLPDLEESKKKFLSAYILTRSIGLGELELLIDDPFLEEIVINSSKEPVWVYHKKHGWLITNIKAKKEEDIKHYASIIARKVGRQISILEPLLDAHLPSGDRANATLFPISTSGNTITIRKFSRDPWTITRMLKNNTLTIEAASIIWMAIQYELSALVAGGTASGKTSMLNSLATIFPPNQRIISIEDTREIMLPKYLHWVPLNTRLPNPEGKGAVTMEDLLVNSLRMRPDRIIVGEVRRKREAETLFEAIHTGHSVYATIHANNAEQTVERLTNPPIEVPRSMIPGISMIIVQFRNRRTGIRRTFEIAEILEDGTPRTIMKYNPKKDRIVKVAESKQLFKTLREFTGYSLVELNNEIREKQKVLKYLVDKDIVDVHDVGRIMALYYTDKEELFDYIKRGEVPTDESL
ncbi:type II/IV secretion system ATPase subunit [Candidatus Woesearchaeota archaeon]|nr:type II/IV secretion system ATPase subunit [Candidatus Woesearchaeota archaeon]